jgi:hypothetical protein
MAFPYVIRRVERAHGVTKVNFESEFQFAEIYDFPNPSDFVFEAVLWAHSGFFTGGTGIIHQADEKRVQQQGCAPI